ncbi:MAG TPA: SurA N-terminal domain-containing protein [Bacteroidales bacterium]|nr:SurA N-terminal domain-containing protein [Bacteroidales bacterium]
MSTLQFLREKAGVLVAGLIGLALFIFVISDFFGSSKAQSRKMRKYYEIGEIKGETVSYQDFETRLQNLREIYKMSGRNNIDPAMDENLREQIWQQMVREKILDSQYEDLGLGVSNEEVDELVLGNNPHAIVQQLFADPETGIFNKSFLVNFLKQTEVDESTKRYWLFFEDEIVNDRLNTKYNTFVSKGLYTTSKQAEFEKQLTQNTVDFSYIMKNFASIRDSSVTVSQADLASYYENHQESFRRTAMRDIEYVIFEVNPSEEDRKLAEDLIKKTKEEFETAANPVEFINLTADTRYVETFVTIDAVPENLQGFMRLKDTQSVFGPYEEDGSFKLARLIKVENRPDSVHVRHILISPDQSMSLSAAKQHADSLIRLIKSGISFEVLAIANSDDQGSAQLGGDLGWFQEGTMVVPFNNACFTGQKGEIKTVETDYGVHIIEILDRSKTVEKYNVGIIDMKITPSSITFQNVYSEASEFAGTNDTYEEFNKAISERNLNKRVANDIAPQQNSLPGLENSRFLIMSLFQAKKGSIILDNNSQAVFDLENKYVVAFCTDVQEEGIAPLEDVTNDVRFAVLKEKKADIISKEFTSKETSLDNLASQMSLQIQEASGINFNSYSVQGLGTEPSLIAAASAAKQGETEGPVEGTNGVFMFVVNNITPSANEEISVTKERLQSTFEMRGMYEAYEALRKNADITDQRYKFY